MPVINCIARWHFWLMIQTIHVGLNSTDNACEFQNWRQIEGIFFVASLYWYNHVKTIPGRFLCRSCLFSGKPCKANYVLVMLMIWPIWQSILYCCFYLFLYLLSCDHVRVARTRILILKNWYMAERQVMHDRTNKLWQLHHLHYVVKRLWRFKWISIIIWTPLCSVI